MILYRILGNDIPLRHGEGQTERALAFVLANEPELPGCEKRFLLNRLVDEDARTRLVAMIEAAGLCWDEIPFVADEYRRLDTLNAKALYLTNQNAARNRCIELGLADADLVLPFDGQAFFSRQAWLSLTAALALDTASYATVPMFRLFANALALENRTGHLREDDEHVRTEPQLVFRRDHDVRFNPHLAYGQANKVELLMRIGAPGPWDDWEGELLDSIRADVRAAPSRSFGRVRDVGHVFRLESGNPSADRDMALRAHARYAGLTEFVERVDASLREPA